MLDFGCATMAIYFPMAQVGTLYFYHLVLTQEQYSAWPVLADEQE